MRVLRTLILLLVITAPMVAHAALPSVAWAKERQPEPPKGFVPMDDVPPGEQIPAINMVAAAYGFVWVAVLGYVWSIARRLKTVESELADLESKKR